MTTVMMVTPFPPQDDGIAAHALELRRALDGSSEVAVLTRTGGGDGPEVYRVLSSGPASLVRAARALRVVRPEVVHYQFNLASFGFAWVWAVAAGLLARRRTGARLVFTLHEVRRDLVLLRGAGSALYRVLGDLADALVVYTAEARDLLVERCGTPAGRISVLPHGCRPLPAPPGEALRTAAAARYGVTPGAALFLGYLHPDKGVEHLIEAAAILARDDPGLLEGVGVVVAGGVRPRRGLFRLFERRDRRYVAELLEAVTRHGLGDVVRFVGPIDEADLAALLELVAVTVLPYTDVTQSGVANLCLAVGTPVVASRLPGLVETLGDAGLYVEPGDHAALASQLGRVLRDSALRRRAHDRMVAMRSSRTYEVSAAGLCDLYRSLGLASGDAPHGIGRAVACD